MIFVIVLPLALNRKYSNLSGEEIGNSRRTMEAHEESSDEYRHLVKIISEFKGQTHSHSTRCTGSLIRPSMILTAGHCVEPDPNYNQTRTIFDVSVHKVVLRKPMLLNV